jgi:signal transduction histidine kinase
LAEIPALVARQPGSVALETVGAPVPIAAEPGHAVYRAVQEALTNAARYAPGADVVVTITFATDRLCVTVEDSGPPPGRAALASQGTGLGLAGMDERIRGVGGSLTAGPRPVGGWSVRVEVPT